MLLAFKRANKMDDSLYFNLRSTDGIVPRIYGLIKVHKANYPIRPIVSMIGSPTYNVAKYVSRLIAPLVGNTNRTVKNTHDFVNFLKTCRWKPHEVMVSFDVVSLFTRVPVQLAIKTIQNYLRSDDNISDRTKLNVDDIMQLVRLCLENNDFIYRGTYYHQSYGCAMGSPISVIAANIVMEDVERRIFSVASDIIAWKRFVDDVWAVVPADKIQSILKLINEIEPTIKFTVEKEDDNNSLSFLDVTISRIDDGTFSTKVYHKPSHTDRYLNFNSNHPFSHKASVARSLYDRAVAFSSSSNDKQTEIGRIRNALRSNDFPDNFLNRVCVKNRKNNKSKDKPTKRVCIPYIRGCSERISRILHSYDVATVFKPVNKLGTVFGLPKDPVDPESVCGVVYEIPCECDKVYVGQTKNSLRTRVQQHRAACRLLQPEKSALAEHAITSNHAIKWTDAKVISRQTGWRQRLLAEAYHTRQRHQHAMNRCDMSFPTMYKSLL